MKVLHLSLEYVPATTAAIPAPVLGGLGRHVHELAHALADLDIEVGVAAPGPSFVDGPVSVYGGEVDDIPDAGLSRLNVVLAAAVAGHAGWDVVHAHDWIVAPAALALSQALDIPLVSTIHADVQAYDQSDPARAAQRLDWEHALVAASCQTIVCSAAMRSAIGARYPSAALHSIAGGVTAAAFAVADVPRDPQLITFFGRLVPYKGCQDLLAALALLRESHPQVRLSVIGDGWYRSELHRLTERYALTDRVHFYGSLAGTRLRNALGRTGIVALPSHYEPFGLVALEAMSAGAPVVASRVGGYAEYISHGVHGLLTDPQNPQSLADALDQLLRSPTTAATLAEQALADVVPRYTWRAAALRTQQVYAAALGRRQ